MDTIADVAEEGGQADLVEVEVQDFVDTRPFTREMSVGGYR
jgi:hypothetical protein